jgi:hypothetical protein
MSMFSGYFKPVSLKTSTAAPMTPPTSKLPAMAQVGMGMADTVKRWVLGALQVISKLLLELLTTKVAGAVKLHRPTAFSA